MKTDTSSPPPFRLRTGDRSGPNPGMSLPVVLVLDRLRSAFNVGNIFRLAEATRAEKIIVCGYTAAPPHPKLEKTARGCDRLVACEHAASVLEAIAKLRRDGYTIYVVDTVDGACAVWDAVIRFPAAFVLGNEALGVESDALAQCHGAVCLPCFGVKNSINVGNCAAVVLYEALRQWLLTIRVPP